MRGAIGFVLSSANACSLAWLSYTYSWFQYSQSVPRSSQMVTTLAGKSCFSKAVEIELDQALQDSENLLSELDVNVKDVQDELAKVKAEKEEIGSWA